MGRLHWWKKAKPHPCLVLLPPCCEIKEVTLCSILDENGGILHVKGIKSSHLCSYEEGAQKFITDSNSSAVKAALASWSSSTSEKEEMKSEVDAENIIKRKREEEEENVKQLLEDLETKMQRVKDTLQKYQREAEDVVEGIKMRRISFSQTCDKVVDRAIKAKREAMLKM